MSEMKKMNPKNTMDKKEYVCKSVFWIFLLSSFYKKILYMDFMNLKDAYPAFLLSFIIILLYKCKVGIHRRRNNWNICKNVIFLYSTSIFYIYYPVYKKIFTIICIIMFMASAACTILIMGRKINKDKKRAVIRKRRVRKSIESVRFIWSFCMSFIMIIPCIPVIFGTQTANWLLRSDHIDTELSGQTILNNIESVCRLSGGIWKKLSLQGKMDVLQTILKIEQENLGLSDKLKIGIFKLRKENLGRYNDSTKQIFINKSIFLDKSSEKLLDTVCHEVYHSYQYRLISVYMDIDEKNRNLKLFRDIGIYKNEFCNYKNGSDDFDSYYTQICENDARKYAEERVKEYYKEIHTYLNSTQK